MILNLNLKNFLEEITKTLLDKKDSCHVLCFVKTGLKHKKLNLSNQKSFLRAAECFGGIGS